jgi:hypothetical protein
MHFLSQHKLVPSVLRNSWALISDHPLHYNPFREGIIERRRGVPMIQYVCDTCSAIKEPEEAWIVGLAAETVGVTSAQREVTLQSVWSRATAVHPLAVHFCSTQCKDEYMGKLFAPEAQVVVERMISSKQRASKKEKVTMKAHRRKKRAA